MTKQKTGEDLLPDDLLWAAGGHASDVVLTAMADGQVEIVPPVVLAHVDRMPRLHDAPRQRRAPLAPRRSRDRVHRRASPTPRALPCPASRLRSRWSSPVLGLVPSLLDTRTDIGSAKTFALHDVPMFVNGLGTLGRRLLEPGSPVGMALTYGAAVLLVIMAFALVRLLPKKEVSR